MTAGSTVESAAKSMANLERAGAYPPLIVLLGPTAVGKTALSIELCRRFGGEIVGADSRQVYRRMDAGTAKPTVTEQAVVPHHLIDVCEPDETLTLSTYQSLACAAIGDIHGRGKVPFLVGGTALYIRAVVEGLRIPEVAPDPELRAKMEDFLEQHGRDALFAWLQAEDPATAAVIDGKNHRRVMRALEIYLTTGIPKVKLEGRQPPDYRILKIGLDRPRPALYARIDQRVDAMIETGLVEEVDTLLRMGYSPKLPSMTGLGYRQVAAYLNGELSRAEAIALIKTETHRFVRHQYTWFQRMEDICWFDLACERSQDQIIATVADFLAQGNVTQAEEA